MRNTFLSLLLLVGCAAPLHTDPPHLLVQVAPASQICAGPEGWAPVDIFITRVGLPPGVVEVKINNINILNLAGQTVVVHLAKAGYGQHVLEASTPEGQRASRIFSVWACPAREGDPLRKKDGTLKGYEG